MALDLESEPLLLKTEPGSTYWFGWGVSFFFFGNGKRKFTLSILYQSLHFQRVTVTHTGFNLLFAFPGF